MSCTFTSTILPFSQIRRLEIPAVTTLHGRLDIPDLYPLFREFDDMRLISISDAQRAPMPWASWLTTVHHGIPEDLHEPRFSTGDYLAFLGRISPEKRVDRAIEIARQAGMPLRVAAKIDDADRSYFEAEISDLLANSDVEFVGEIGEHEKTDFLGNAAALLFPIDWPEPFGLVMIESMACGTPVVAFRGGSVAEIVDQGVTGFIVESVEEAMEAVETNSVDRSPGVPPAVSRALYFAANVRAIFDCVRTWHLGKETCRSRQAWTHTYCLRSGDFYR